MLILLACAGGGSPPDTAAIEADTVLRGALSFRLPLEEPDLFSLRIGVDHDPTVYEDQLWTCTDYAGRAFPSCYDQHDGSDYILEGGFETMDAGSTVIVAAADGVVVATEDGHYDRCHADLGSADVSCDGYEMIANSVTIEHDTGNRTLYWHMKTDSVLVEVGQAVSAGDPLGLVGSSGFSSMPHLHFELQDSAGGFIDPYAGEYSQPETWWCQQGELDDLPGLCSED
jgi:murein DD-endopeptidase MepM/ murein hydrolase activator NlpD